MISKELLSEVLNQNVTSVYKQQEQYRYTTSNINGAWVSGSDVPFPNIYELAHKCKEWAYKVAKFPIKLETSPTDEYGEEYSIGSWFLCGIEGNHPKTNNTIKRYTLVHYGQNEPEAIFKACEWIMEQTKCGS